MRLYNLPSETITVAVALTGILNSVIDVVVAPVRDRLDLHGTLLRPCLQGDIRNTVVGGRHDAGARHLLSGCIDSDQLGIGACRADLELHVVELATLPVLGSAIDTPLPSVTCAVTTVLCALFEPFK